LLNIEELWILSLTSQELQPFPSSYFLLTHVFPWSYPVKHNVQDVGLSKQVAQGDWHKAQTPDWVT
jgi:hypothetical protein